MKRYITYALPGVVGFFVLVGLAAFALLAYGLLSFGCHGTDDYEGEDCKESIACRQLPLPPQADEDFPMAVDSCTPVDYTGFIIFRAPADWQDAFLKLYPQAEVPFGDSAASLACDLAESAGNASIQRFIQSHRWQPFHQGHFRPRGGSDAYDFATMRDESGEYLLVFFMDY